ncbi:MAG: FMN-binding protein [Flavobacteriales bacterium]|nr:FMN-binding protein [Flavobacteriales bacterium]
MKTRSFHSRRKWIATAVVSAFFLFFWINGPFQNIIDLQIDSSSSFQPVAPVLIGTKNKVKSRVKTVGNMETSGIGFAMILDQKESVSAFPIIDLTESEVSGSTYGKELLGNSERYFNLPNASFKLKQSSQVYYALIQVGTMQYYYFQSKGVSDQIKGYSGPINVGVFLNEEGLVHQVVHVSSVETRSYMEKISRSHYYHQYDHIALDRVHDIDAISGATISSKAMALTTTDLIDKINPNPLADFVDRSGLSAFEAKASLTWYWIPQLVLIFILFLYAFQKRLKKSKKYVLMTAIASVAFIGFYLNDSFTYVTFLHPFIGTSLSSFMGLYALFVLLGAIWGKNTYCKYICPYGNIQRLQLKLWKGATRKFPLSNKWVKNIRFFITILLICGVIAGLRNLSHLEPFPYLFGMEIQSLWYFMFAVFGLLINWIYPMIWCRILCPTGSVLDTISVISSKKVTVKLGVKNERNEK